jgi:hypothetical protein
MRTQVGAPFPLQFLWTVPVPLPRRIDNPLQTAVLNLFVSVKSRFPNLVVGAITRDSVRKALLSGITADQVRVGRLLFQFFLLQWELSPLMHYISPLCVRLMNVIWCRCM